MRFPLEILALSAQLPDELKRTNPRTKPCPSTKKREEICPECGETHNNENHLYCTKKCARDAGVID